MSRGGARVVNKPFESDRLGIRVSKGKRVSILALKKSKIFEISFCLQHLTLKTQIL